MRIICGNCGDTIEEVDDSYQPTMFQHKSVEESGEVVIVETGTRCCGGSD